ncbi:Protein of unknown function [Bacillus cereus]|nr:Protein of unknown function [Bacillus cereus]SCN39201.1 Protein of unknown function [Bacillus wiedmannii]
MEESGGVIAVFATIKR